MMKILFYPALFITVFIFIALMVLSVSSRKQPEVGLVNGQLRACPDRPNCVCSEYSGIAAFVEPLTYSIAHVDAWQGIREAITATGGKIILDEGQYLHATFVTPVLRFVDDVEVRLDEQRNMIHIRSASRVGHSDLGANHRRVEKIREMFAPKWDK